MFKHFNLYYGLMPAFAILLFSLGVLSVSIKKNGRVTRWSKWTKYPVIAVCVVCAVVVMSLFAQESEHGFQELARRFMSGRGTEDDWAGFGLVLIIGAGAVYGALLYGLYWLGGVLRYRALATLRYNVVHSMRSHYASQSNKTHNQSGLVSTVKAKDLAEAMKAAGWMFQGTKSRPAIQTPQSRSATALVMPPHAGATNPCKYER